MEFVDLKKQHLALKKELMLAIGRVLDSGHFLLGPELENFEKETAVFCNTKYAAGVGSGTEALVLALKALDIGNGDEVITTPLTFIATANAIKWVGAKPIFADIDEQSFNIDPRKIASAITKRTKAIIPVHLFGICCDMENIAEIARQNTLFVIEDAAQAFGAEINQKKIGALSDVACVSFSPIKNLGACGNGGLILTNNEMLAKKVKLLRSHGADKPGRYKIVGVSGELDEIQAAILRIKIRYLNSWNQRRINIARLYNKLLEPIKKYIRTPTTPEAKKHVFYAYTVLAQKRDGLKNYLKERGIPTRIYYTPLHLQPALKFLNHDTGDFPVAEKIASSIISLPIYPELTDQEIKIIAQAVVNFYS